MLQRGTKRRRSGKGSKKRDAKRAPASPLLSLFVLKRQDISAQQARTEFLAMDLASRSDFERDLVQIYCTKLGLPDDEQTRDKWRNLPLAEKRKHVHLSQRRSWYQDGVHDKIYAKMFWPVTGGADTIVNTRAVHRLVGPAKTIIWTNIDSAAPVGSPDLSYDDFELETDETPAGCSTRKLAGEKKRLLKAGMAEELWPEAKAQFMDANAGRVTRAHSVALRPNPNMTLTLNTLLEHTRLVRNAALFLVNNLIKESKWLIPDCVEHLADVTPAHVRGCQLWATLQAMIAAVLPTTAKRTQREQEDYSKLEEALQRPF